MNKKKRDILNCIMNETFINQRVLSEQCGHSLGSVNKSMKELIR